MANSGANSGPDIDYHWYRSSYTLLTVLLLPLSWFFHLIVNIRRALYCLGIKKTHHFPTPIIVVGNITVGGTGKTPFVIWLASYLKKQGWRPGIVSRGVGGAEERLPRWVDENADPRQVGDEAILLRRRTLCPVVIGVDRVAAVKALLEKSDCNIVISDDGLQHYRLGRDIEILIVDGARRFGNKNFLPAGPLRESISRLKQVDFVISQQQAEAGEYLMLLQGNDLVSLKDASQKKPLAHFKNTKVHGVAAIGNPKRFFSALRAEEIDVVPHVFPDHYLYQKNDIDFGDALPVMMTEKDAVKCARFADKRHWYLPVDAKLDDAFEERLLKKLKMTTVDN